MKIQILGDTFGHYVHLAERECSIQKRYQKLIEEAPAPGIDASILRSMGEDAVKVAKGCGYVNAGTADKESLIREVEEGFVLMRAAGGPA